MRKAPLKEAGRYDMIKSMTGYGKSVAALQTGNLTVEIRTLNSKSADISIKSSLLPRDRELEMRALIASVLQRGTIDVYLGWEPSGEAQSHGINKDAAREILAQCADLGGESAAIASSPQASAYLIGAVLRLPEVLETKKQEVINEDNWPLVQKAFEECLEAVNAYREKEGAVLYADITSRIANILSLYDEVESFEPERIASVRSKILKALDELGQKPDPVRFEQEMIFYLEKYDINEERVRLRQHCRYFMDTIDGDPAPGKKLGFIIQEMGREINTTGSKANHAGIQKCVVRMKDELEKIREQSMNVL